MQISASDLAVAMNTLHASLGIKGDTVFMYTAEARERVLDKLSEILHQTPIEIGEPIEPESTPPLV
jgi:hypothetical protein